MKYTFKYWNRTVKLIHGLTDKDVLSVRKALNIKKWTIVLNFIGNFTMCTPYRGGLLILRGNVDDPFICVEYETEQSRKSYFNGLCYYSREKYGAHKFNQLLSAIYLPLHHSYIKIDEENVSVVHPNPLTDKLPVKKNGNMTKAKLDEMYTKLIDEFHRLMDSGQLYYTFHDDTNTEVKE